MAEAGGEMEMAALAGMAFDPDASIHERDQLAADGEPEAGAAVGARGGVVGLGDGLEKGIELVLGDPDAGVGDVKRQGQRPGGGGVGGSSSGSW